MIKIEKYPKDFQEFLAQFKSEDDCWDYIFEMRWPDGFICPKCASQQYWIKKNRLIHCSNCGHQA
jgi:DNA-directed RNA polymerase subunit RPC12/RpoP